MSFNTRPLAGLVISLAVALGATAGLSEAQAAVDSIVKNNVDTLLLLLPDDQSTTDPKVTVWLDAAAEEGLHVQTITDTKFLALGTGALGYSGVIFPDQVHVKAADNLIAALQTYVSQGGNLMLVYDAGSLTSTGFYPVPKSRLSSLAGVDYVLYDQLRDQTIGLGNVTGMRSRMAALHVPPGKSMPYLTTTTTTVPTTTATATPAATTTAAGLTTTTSFSTSSSSAASTSASTTASPPCYLPSSADDVGGLVKNHSDKKIKSAKKAKGSNNGNGNGNANGSAILSALLSYFSNYSSNSSSSNANNNDENDDSQLPLTCVRLPAVSHGNHHPNPNPNPNPNPGPLPRPTPIPAPDVLHGVSGYVYGFLTYPSFVTQGTYAGDTMLTSPNYGLVAGINKVGTGKVLFVNTPLGYLKGYGTDGLLMHGFLHYFAVEMLQLPYQAAVPGGTAGMVLNWHLDSEEALDPIDQLGKLGVWNQGPFSIDMTAGPDTIVPGDKLGFNLPANARAKTWLRTFVANGHQVGSHGGWIHDYFGTNVTELNAATFLPYLVLNKNAIEAVTGKPVLEYSAPQGNTPKWSVDWMEKNGILGYYWTGDSGMSPTRAYREGQLFNKKIWTIPLSTYGKIATFEEFEDTLTPGSEATTWLQMMTDFVVQYRTSRLVYMHPPGAMTYPTTVTTLLNRAKAYQGANVFRWYTMVDLSRFLTEREKTTWTMAKLANGQVQITASHPTNLVDQAWALPKTKYSQPIIDTASRNNGDVRDDGVGEWVVTARKGTTFSFRTTPTP